MTPPAARTRGYLVGLDGLRGLAALAVLVDHTAQHASDQTVGVLRPLLGIGAQGLTVFFVLSGFLIYRPFVSAILDGRPTPRLLSYVRNRLLRILPAYWIVFVIIALIIGVAYVHGDATYFTRPDDIGRLSDPLMIAANLLLVQTYIPTTMLTGIAPAWSLTTELTFYLVLPVVVAGGVALARRGLPAKAAAIAPPALFILAGIATVTCIVVGKAGLDPTAYWLTAWGPTGGAVLERSILAQGALFGLGMLVAWGVEVKARSARWFMEGHVRAGFLSVAFALAARGVMPDLVGNNVLGVGAAVLLFTVLVPTPAGSVPWHARVLESPLLRGVGLISYSVYLWHLPVITWLVTRHLTEPGAAGMGLNLLMVLALTIPLATATYLLVERPALRLKRRRVAAPPSVDVRTVDPASAAVVGGP